MIEFKMGNVKYSVILREGKNTGKKQYFQTSKDKIKRVFDSYEFDNNGECYAAMAHIAGNDTKHGEKEDMLKINKKKSLLEFTCRDEKTANKDIEYCKLGVPFPEFKNNS